MPRLRVQVGGALAGNSDWSNTFEFLLSGSIATQAALQSVMNAIYTTLAASTPFKTGYGSDSTMVNLKGLYYPSNTGPSSFVAQSVGAAVVGIAAPVMAPQVCVVASLRTNIAGRSYRGRVFVPYRAGNISSAGVVNSTGQTAVASYVQAVVSAVASALTAQSLTASWVVWSPTKGTGTPVTAILVGSQCDTIRHRNRNRAEAYVSFTPPSTTLEVPSAAEADAINALRNSFVKAHVDPSVAGNLDDVAGLVVDAVAIE